MLFVALLHNVELNASVDWKNRCYLLVQCQFELLTYLYELLRASLSKECSPTFLIQNGGTLCKRFSG